MFLFESFPVFLFEVVCPLYKLPVFDWFIFASFLCLYEFYIIVSCVIIYLLVDSSNVLLHFVSFELLIKRMVCRRDSMNHVFFMINLIWYIYVNDEWRYNKPNPQSATPVGPSHIAVAQEEEEEKMMTRIWPVSFMVSLHTFWWWISLMRFEVNILQRTIFYQIVSFFCCFQSW